MNLELLTIVAQSSFREGLGEIVNVIRLVSMILCFGALIYSGVNFAIGRVESALWGLGGAGICGLAWVITQKLYEAGGADTIDIPL